MSQNPVVLRSRLITLQMDLLAIRSKLAGGDRQEAMAWQALNSADEAIGWALTHLGPVASAHLSKSEQAKEAAIRG